MPILQQAEHSIINGGNFVDRSNNVINVGADPRKGKGVESLLTYVQREAMHDSDSRGDLGCHPGTREEYIRNITSWGRGEWESKKRVFLMTGPAGAGKSAIARTCAHRLKAAGNFGASFFFYRPSRWNDPRKFIPTIVYQLTTRYPPYCDCIDALIINDPLVLDKAMNIQFLELLVKPLLQLCFNGYNIEPHPVIIIDGLDECATVDAQLQIIDLITTSIHERTTPFLWAFFSRPEPPITSAFSSEIVTNISWTLPLTLSGNADSDIEAYLRGSFKVIRAKHNIPLNIAWPTQSDIRRLVSQSAGLFVYAVTAIRYIHGLSNGRAGLEKRLCLVLRADPTTKETPFSALDRLYVLVMMQIPEGVFLDTMSLLHLDQSTAYNKYTRGRPKTESKVIFYCLALGLSSLAFHAAISNLYSVLEVTVSESGVPKEIQFYHKSFLDFLLDPTRSESYFIRSPGVRRHCLETVVRSLSGVFNANPFFERNSLIFLMQAFFTLVEEHNGKLEESTLQLISQIVWDKYGDIYYEVHFPTFIQKIPHNWRRKIIRPSRSASLRLSGQVDRLPFLSLCSESALYIRQQILAMYMPERYEAMCYILGQGVRRRLIEKYGLFWEISTRSR